MPIDTKRRLEYATRIASRRKELDELLRERVPFELQPKFVYKNPPRDRIGLIRVGSKDVPVCVVCGYERPPKSHFGKPTGKFPNRHEGETKLVDVGQWARLKPLKVSSKLLLKYMSFMKHPKIFHGKGEDRKPTANENAIRQLLLKFPEDPVYPLVLEISKLRTLAGRYIGKIGEDGKVHGGLLVGADGRVHPVFSHTPSTLRQASENPNMQNIPRDRADDEWYGMVKRMFVASPGSVYVERDFSGIESILVGYFSGSRLYTRLSMIDIHSFVTAWALYELERKLKYEDVPKAEWSDNDLRLALKDIKKRFKPNRQGVKHMGHAANYMAKSKKIQEVLFDELGIMVPVREIKKFLDFYKQLFPEIPLWHQNLARQVDGTKGADIPGIKTGAGYARNPFGYLHRFYEVIRWKKIHGKWEWELGEAANALIAFGPQSTAAGILKEAAIRFDDARPDLSEFFRLFIHDSILGEVPKGKAEEFNMALKEEMNRPIPELPLDPAWEMGKYLWIPSEAKIGEVWGEMVDMHD